MQKHSGLFSLNSVALWALLLSITAAPLSALSFQVLPKVSDVDRKLANMGANSVTDPLAQFVMSGLLPLVKSPVHEAITLNAVGCNVTPGQEKDCVVLGAIQANRFLLYGVRWPDDPPFTLDANKPPANINCDPRVTVRSTAQPKCWLGLFNDAGSKSKTILAKKPSAPAFGPGYYILYRSHYGDLQFFHAMAANDGERAVDTQRRLKMWAQFLWGVALGQVRTDKPIRDLGFADLKTYFPGEITVTNLFSTGLPEVRKDLDKVALGVLLHMVQDSFSAAHADRAPETGGKCEQIDRFSKPGKVTQFYSYANQTGKTHDEEDTFNALGLKTIQTSPTVVDASRDFIALWTEKPPWEQASKFFDCVFDLQNPDALAGPGRFVGQPTVVVVEPGE
jgi:hypothetical protein